MRSWLMTHQFILWRNVTLIISFRLWINYFPDAWNLKFWKSSRVKSFTGKWRIPVISHRKRAMRLLITESIGVLIPSTTSSFRDLLKKKTEEINSKTSVIRFREKVSRNSKNFTLRIQQVNEKNFSLRLWFFKFLQNSSDGPWEGGLLYKYLM